MTAQYQIGMMLNHIVRTLKLLKVKSILESITRGLIARNTKENGTSSQSKRKKNRRGTSSQRERNTSRRGTSSQNERNTNGRGTSSQSERKILEKLAENMIRRGRKNQSAKSI